LLLSAFDLVVVQNRLLVMARWLFNVGSPLLVADCQSTIPIFPLTDIPSAPTIGKIYQGWTFVVGFPTIDIRLPALDLTKVLEMAPFSMLMPGAVGCRRCLGQ
jgi:hypothetical protein